MAEDDKKQEILDLQVVAKALFEWITEEDEGIIKNYLKSKYHETISEIVKRISSEEEK